MSALGQKRTCRDVRPMSALPPITDIRRVLVCLYQIGVSSVWGTGVASSNLAAPTSPPLRSASQKIGAVEIPEPSLRCNGYLPGAAGLSLPPLLSPLGALLPEPAEPVGDSEGLPFLSELPGTGTTEPGPFGTSSFRACAGAPLAPGAPTDSSATTTNTCLII
jgi:hypothetical protein